MCIFQSKYGWKCILKKNKRRYHFIIKKKSGARKWQEGLGRTCVYLNQNMGEMSIKKKKYKRRSKPNTNTEYVANFKKN